MFSSIKKWFSKAEKPVADSPKKTNDIVLDCPCILLRYEKERNIVIVNVFWPSKYPKEQILKVIPGMLADLETGVYHQVICATIGDFCVKNNIANFGEQLLEKIDDMFDGGNLLKLNDLAMLPSDVFKEERGPDGFQQQ